MNLSVVYVTEILAIHIRFLAEGMSHRPTRNKPARENASLRPRVTKDAWSAK